MKKATHSIPFSSLALAFSLLASGAAQAEWIKSYGTKNNETGAAMPSKQGGYYLSMISTPTASKTKSVALFSLLDANGKAAWTKQITTGKYDYFSLNELGSGRVLLQGTTQLSATSPDNAVWAIYDVNRTTGALSPKFSKTYKKGNHSLYFSEDSQGILWGMGSTSAFSQNGQGTDLILAKINTATGLPAWSKVYHYGYDDSVRAIIPKGQNFILAVNTQNANADSQKILLGQLNKLGVPVAGSFKEYDGNGLSTVINIEPISGGNYLLYGTNQSSIADKNPTVFVMKLNSSLNVVWGKKYAAGADQGLSTPVIDENADGSYTLTGNLTTADNIQIPGIPFPIPMSSQHPAVIQISSTGAVISGKSFGYQNDTAVFTKGANSTYLLSGQMMPFIDITSPNKPVNIDALYGHFSADVAPHWVKTLGGPKNDFGFISPQPTGYWLSGFSSSWGVGNMDVVAGKLDTNGDVPGCQYIKEVTMLETALNITAEDLNWHPQPAVLVKKGAIIPTGITLNVTDATIATTNVCSN
ncbi:MAG: hypothetical protein Q8N96_06495 [Methylovulum sp.]|nr:hypothetical protein [Methylovulum sp.]